MDPTVSTRREESDEAEAVNMLKVLPMDCIAKVLSLTTPVDACRSSLVSTSFKSVAESNAVWDCFVPPESDYLFNNSSSSSSSSSLPISSKKELFLHLCNHPLLIHDGKLVIFFYVIILLIHSFFFFFLFFSFFVSLPRKIWIWA